MIDVGVIGCGYWGPNLVRNFHQLPDCRLAMCCDLDSDKLAAIHNLYPMAKTTTNYLDFLDSQINAMAIATPPGRTTKSQKTRCCTTSILWWKNPWP